MMAPDLYQNMPPYWEGGGGVFAFLIYIVRTYVSSHSIGPATPQENNVMPMYTFDRERESTHQHRFDRNA